MLNKIVTRGVQIAVISGICCLEGHLIDACSTLQKGNINTVYSNQGQRRYDPYSNTCNEGWRDQPNLGMALKPIHLILSKHLVNLLIKIGLTS